MAQARFWPNPTQKLLLRLCLEREAERARSAWEQWKRRVDLDDLDQASFRIMSFAYTRLSALNVNDPDSARIKGIYRYQWTKNQIAFRGKAQLLRVFAEQSIPTLLLKGSALCHTVYPEPTARPMHDLDLLVPVGEAARVVKLLQDQGWEAQHFAPEKIIQELHACSFLHPEFGELDLHWYVFRSHCHERRNAGLWAAAVEHRFQDAPTQILCPADQFLHACEHSMHYSPSSSLQWLVDACLILRCRERAMDWERLVTQAREFELILPVRKTLLYLQKYFAEPVPSEVLRDLADAQVSFLARFEYFLAGRPEGKQQGYGQKIGMSFCHHLRKCEGRPLLETLRDFPDFLRLISHYEGDWGQAFLDFALMIYLGLKRRVRDGLGFLLDGICGRALIQAKEVTAFAAHQMNGFYREETLLGQIFRWSEPAASLSLELHAEDSEWVWEFPHFFQGKVCLERELRLWVNGHELTAEQIKCRGHELRFCVPRSYLREGRERKVQKLSWSIRAFQPKGKDVRWLGLPLWRLRILRVKRKQID
jgi:hypothetical protein